MVWSWAAWSLLLSAGASGIVNLTVLGELVLASCDALLIFGEEPPPAIYPGVRLIGAGVALAVYHESRAPAPAPPL